VKSFAYFCIYMYVHYFEFKKAPCNNSWASRGGGHLDPHQGFAVDPLVDSRQSPELLTSTAPLLWNSWIRHWILYKIFSDEIPIWNDQLEQDSKH
jgi:hypothetical protein